MPDRLGKVNGNLTNKVHVKLFESICKVNLSFILTSERLAKTTDAMALWVKNTEKVSDLKAVSFPVTCRYVTRCQVDGGIFRRRTRDKRERETQKRESGSLWAPSLDVSQRSLDPGSLITDARLFQTDVLSPWRRLALPLHQTHSCTKKGDNDLQCAKSLCLLQQSGREVTANDEDEECRPTQPGYAALMNTIVEARFYIGW